MTTATLSAQQAADALVADIGALPTRDTPSIRALRRGRTREWRAEPPDFIFAVACAVSEARAYLWVGYELIRHHRGALDGLDDRAVARLARGLDSWENVDSFARILSGPAWARGQISDNLIDQWSRSADRWLRRAALVSTVALNSPGDGGVGDAPRTLSICARLAQDRDDMVVKALSWALRALSGRDRQAVSGFLAAHDRELSARVKREVAYKLRTGRKSPRPVSAR